MQKVNDIMSSGPQEQEPEVLWAVESSYYPMILGNFSPSINLWISFDCAGRVKVVDLAKALMVFKGLIFLHNNDVSAPESHHA
jgi:hypothetical protein